MTPPAISPPVDALLVHAAWVRALAARLVDAGDEDADDLAQDVYVAALSAAGRVEVRSTSGWLAGAARKLVLRGRRGVARRRARATTVCPSLPAQVVIPPRYP
jgi:DNA-directed RNA polymerase specialized sigma24 family protein